MRLGIDSRAQAGWSSLLFFVAGGRVAARSFEPQLLLRGIGRRRRLIVGTDAGGAPLLHDLELVPDREFEGVWDLRAKMVKGPKEHPLVRAVRIPLEA